MHSIGINSLLHPVVLENLYKQVTKTYHKIIISNKMLGVFIITTVFPQNLAVARFSGRLDFEGGVYRDRHAHIHSFNNKQCSPQHTKGILVQYAFTMEFSLM